MAVFSAAASIFGGKAQAKAARQAGQASQEALDRTLEFNQDVYDDAVARTEPYREVGLAGLERIQAGIDDGSFDLSAYPEFEAPQFDFEADPGYQFRLEEGLRAINQTAAARGSFQSGNTLRDAATFASGLASQEYGNAFARFNTNRNFDFATFQDRYNRERLERDNAFGRLTYLTGVGERGVNTATAAGNAFAAAQQNALQANAQNQGNAAISRGNALANAATGVANGVNNAIGQFAGLNSAGLI